ncbi:MAG: hypothetical protein OXH99_10325 [Bryobacterales bacterium]|nr:hypothetical protein [Bryobacterales bacterium]
MDKKTEVWLRMYEEQIRHARHHETLRTHSTNVIVIISAAILALISSDNSSTAQHTMLCVFLIVANGYGLFISLKHWERSCLHHSVSGRYRTIVSEHTALGEANLNTERKVGRTQHLRNFPLLGMLPAHVLWSGLHAVIVLMAIALLL